MKLIANPVTSPLMRLALGSEFIQKDIFSIAVTSKKTLTKDISGYARIVRMEKSAHLPMLEEPEVYAGALLEF